MKLASCSHERTTITAVQTGTWTDALRLHLISCTCCQETVHIAGVMRSLAVVDDNPRPLPDANVIWLKAQLAQRRASATEALKPVETFQRVAWGVSALALFLGLRAKWTWLEKGIHWLNTGWGSLVSQAGSAGLLSVLGLLALGLLAVASLLSLDHEFRGNQSDNDEADRTTGGSRKRRFRGRNLPILLALLFTLGCGRFDETLVGEFQHRSSDGFRRLQVASTGQIEFTENEQDILHMSSGGHFVILEKKGLTTRKLEIEPGPDGKLTRSYTYRGEPRPFDGEARAWFGALLQELIREGRYGAEARAQRILQRQGPIAVLEEITRIKRDHVKSIYFRELASAGALDLATKQRMIRQASEELSSDAEKARVFEEFMTHFWRDAGLRESLTLSVHTVHSDGERARLLMHLLEQPDTSTKDLEPIMRLIQRISSDGEKSRLLQRVSAQYGSADPVRMAFFQALNSMHSDGDRHATLTAFLKNTAIVREDLKEAMESIAQLSSDGEKAGLLVEITQLYQEDGVVRTAFFRATDTLRSDGERRRVLSALLARKPTVETLQSILQATRGISSDGEKAALLVEMANECLNSPALLVSFLQLSNSLSSDGEYRRVMSTVFENTEFLMKVALQKGS